MALDFALQPLAITSNIHEVNQEQQTIGQVQQLKFSQDKVIMLKIFQFHLSSTKLVIKKMATKGFDSSNISLCLVWLLLSQSMNVIGYASIPITNVSPKFKASMRVRTKLKCMKANAFST